MFGHSRINIYLSNLIICVITAIFCELIYLVFVFIIGIPIFGKLQMTISQFAMSILNVILVIITYCSIFNFITMLFSEITVSTTVCIVLFIAMFIADSSLLLTINTSQYITNSYWEDGIEHIISQELDPNYPGEQVIKIARTIHFFIPQGQANEIANVNTAYLKQLPFYSITLISIVNIGGIYLFTKKELK